MLFRCPLPWKCVKRIAGEIRRDGEEELVWSGGSTKATSRKISRIVGSLLNFSVLAIGSRDGVISIEKKRRSRRKEAESRQVKGVETSRRGVAWDEGRERMDAQSGSQNHRQSRRENEPA